MSWRPRDKAAYAHALLALLPLGEIWPRAQGTTLVRFITALAGGIARWADRTAYFLLIEAFPPTSTPAYMLGDWERVLGLPEPCFPAGQTIEERQIQVRDKLARRPGGASRAYFTGIAQRLGYHNPGPGGSDLSVDLQTQLEKLNQIRIVEYRPFMFGVSRLGDPTWQIAPPKMRFLWVVRLPGRRLSWFRFGQSRLGADAHLVIRRAEDLECIFKKLRPAHTNVIFDYSGGLSI